MPMPRKYFTDEERKAAKHEEYLRNKDRYRASNKRWAELNKDKVEESKNKSHRNTRPYVQNNEWDKVEGYDMVLRDGCDWLHVKNRWVIHHKLEREFSVEQLKAADMYYNRPPHELVWMTRKAHTSMHLTWNNPMRNKNKLVNT